MRSYARRMARGGLRANTAGGKESTLQLAANPTGVLAFDKKTLRARTGKVTIVMTGMRGNLIVR